MQNPKGIKERVTKDEKTLDMLREGSPEDWTRKKKLKTITITTLDIYI
ncbi:hypothetical protein LCGC14_1336820 [marine sediment metagenome]|uniref:Uncharacterized protein n=1 Tax=marine sediment metagenome TaxID=412755 RepID=A0A0F9L153_9ZZZZ